MSEGRRGAYMGQPEITQCEQGINQLQAMGVFPSVYWSRLFDIEDESFRDWIYRNGVPYLSINKSVWVDRVDIVSFGKVFCDAETGERRRLNLPGRQGLGGECDDPPKGRKPTKGRSSRKDS